MKKKRQLFGLEFPIEISGKEGSTDSIPSVNVMAS